MMVLHWIPLNIHRDDIKTRRVNLLCFENSETSKGIKNYNNLPSIYTHWCSSGTNDREVTHHFLLKLRPTP